MEEDIRSRSQISRFVPRDHGLVDTVNKICETLKWLLPNLIPSFHMVGGKNQHLKIVLWLPLLQHGIRILFPPNEYIVTFTKALRSICKFLFCKKNKCFFTIFITQLDTQNSHLSSSMSGLVSTSYHTHTIFVFPQSARSGMNPIASAPAWSGHPGLWRSQALGFYQDQLYLQPLICTFCAVPTTPLGT